MDLRQFYADHKTAIHICGGVAAVGAFSFGGGFVLGAIAGKAPLIAMGAKIKVLASSASACGSNVLTYCGPKLAHGTVHGAGVAMGHALMTTQIKKWM